MLTVSHVARIAKVAPNTVRNHVRDFPDLFSEAARGLQGNRMFNEDDVEAICSLVALKDSGMPLAEAAMRLRSQEAPTVIDVAATPLQRPASPQEGPQAPLATQLALSTMQQQINALQRQHATLLRAAVLWGALWGAIAALAFAAFVVWVLWLVTG